MDINERIRRLDFQASMDSPRGAEFLALRFRPSTPTSPDTLWNYLTQPDKLQLWSPIVPDTPLTDVGSRTCYETPNSEGQRADVSVADPPRELVHMSGPHRVTWAISPKGRTLTCTMELQQPEYASLYAASWQVCFGVLDALLAGEDQERLVGLDAMQHGWPELQKQYVADLPGQAAELPF